MRNRWSAVTLGLVASAGIGGCATTTDPPTPPPGIAQCEQKIESRPVEQLTPDEYGRAMKRMQQECGPYPTPPGGATYRFH